MATSPGAGSDRLAEIEEKVDRLQFTCDEILKVVGKIFNRNMEEFEQRIDEIYGESDANPPSSPKDGNIPVWVQESGVTPEDMGKPGTIGHDHS